MAKFIVNATETVSYTIAVDADTPEEAVDLAKDEIGGWGVEPSSNLPPDDIELMIVNVFDADGNVCTPKGV